VEIRNKRGDLLHRYDEHDFADLDLPEAVFAGMVLEGAHFSCADLSGANFRGTDLYWGIFFLANLTGADFEGAQLQRADFKKANLTNANFEEHAFGSGQPWWIHSVTGGESTGADLRGAILTGAEYDAETIFPLGFHPENFRLIFKGYEDSEERTSRWRTDGSNRDPSRERRVMAQNTSLEQPRPYKPQKTPATAKS
jgi:hypothetical protein